MYEGWGRVFYCINVKQLLRVPGQMQSLLGCMKGLVFAIRLNVAYTALLVVYIGRDRLSWVCTGDDGGPVNAYVVGCTC